MGQSAARLVLAAPFVVLWIVGTVGVFRTLIKTPEADAPWIIFGYITGIGGLGMVFLLA